MLIVEQQMQSVPWHLFTGCENVTFTGPTQTWAYTTTSATAVKGGASLTVGGAPFDCATWPLGGRGRLAAPAPGWQMPYGNVARVLRFAQRPNALGTPVCTLDGGAPANRIEINTTAAVEPLVVPLSGAIALDFPYPPYGGDNIFHGSCHLLGLDPVSIPGVGVLCATPTYCYASSLVDCDGRLPFDVDLVTEADLGACSDPYGCADTCYSYCYNQGLDRAAWGCTGFCGSYHLPCDRDADCAPYGVTCNGPEPVGAAAGICQCTCENRNASGGRPGEMQCNVGAALRIEAGLPCDGLDTLADFGSQCLGLTTGLSRNVLHHADFGPASLPLDGTAENVGEPLSCNGLAAGTTAGLALRGALNTLGTGLGDVAAEVFIDCQ